MKTMRSRDEHMNALIEITEKTIQTFEAITLAEIDIDTVKKAIQCTLDWHDYEEEKNMTKEELQQHYSDWIWQGLENALNIKKKGKEEK